MCYNVRIFGILKNCPCGSWGFRVCVNVCVNKKTPPPERGSKLGENDLSKRLKRRNDLLFFRKSNSANSTTGYSRRMLSLDLRIYHDIQRG